MKDAKGHGSNPRGVAAHQTGVEQVTAPEGGHIFDMSMSKVKLSPAIDTQGWSGDFSKLWNGGKTFQSNLRTAEGNAFTVSQIRGAMQRGEPIPAIEVNHEGEVSEGHHRYVAASLEGAKTIKARRVP